MFFFSFFFRDGKAISRKTETSIIKEEPERGFQSVLTIYKWSHESALENGACRYSATIVWEEWDGSGREGDGYQMNARERGAGRKRTQRIRRSVWDLGPKPSDQIISLSGGLLVRGHATADGHGVLATSLLLLLLQVLVVGHLLLLLVGHVARVHTGAHIPLGRVDVVVCHILGSLGGDIGGVDAVLAGSGVRGIQTGLTGS